MKLTQPSVLSTTTVPSNAATVRPTMCNPRPTPGTDRVENHDPKTDSPVFLVHLAREDAVGWKVVFNFAAADRPGDSGEG